MPGEPKIELDPSVKGRLRLGWARLNGVRVRPSDPVLETEMAAFCEALRHKLAETAHLHEVLGPARRLYRAFGVEPTRRRPSSEALIRRVLKGKGLYQVNTVVDVCNWCSMDFGLPIGLYDTDKIVGDVLCRVGRENEGYPGIGKDWVNLEGRVTLVDAHGPFGNPSSDSYRTSVDEATTRILFVLFAPREYNPQVLESQLDTAVSRMRRHNGGELVNSALLA